MAEGSADTLDATRGVFDRLGADGEPLTTAEVTEALDCSRRTTYNRLRRLADDGVIDTKKVGARGRVWWRDPSRADESDADGATDTGVDVDTDTASHHSAPGLQAGNRERERYEAVVETLGDGVYILDEESRFVLVNDAHTELTGYDREELLGAHASLVTTDDDLALAERRYADLEPGENEVVTVETELVTKEGRRLPVQTRFSLFPLEDDSYGRVGVVRDISEDRTRRRKLETRVRQQEVVTQLGRLALETRDLDHLMTRVADLVSKTLDTDYCKVLDLDTDTDELLLRQGVGWRDGIVGEATVSAVDDDSQAAHTLWTRSPIVVENLDREQRFGGPELLTSHDVSSGISTIIGSFDEPWGILGTHDTERRTFSEHDVNFVQSVAHILSTAIDRHAFERRIERQREQLDALNDLSGVIRDLTEAAIAQSTREEVERTVCDRLTDTGIYQFAWVGAFSRSVDAVRLTATSGCGPTERDELSLAEPSSAYAAMVDTAIRTQTVQVRRRADLEESAGDRTDATDAADTADPAATADAPPDLFRSPPDAPDVRSYVAIPIVHVGMVFGVVCVATARPNAFESDERAIIDHLGESIGHMIAGIERKRALMSDEVIELRFQTTDLSTALGLSSSMDGTIEIDTTVELEENTHAAFGTVTDDTIDALEELAHADSQWEQLTITRREGDENTFEAVLTEPPVTSAVAEQGGEVVEARIVDGTVRLGFHLPPGADVRAIRDVVESRYPGIEMATRRQLTRTEPRFDTVLDAELTDRQRTVLETSYEAGFFEWPRESSGETIAELLDISPSTFHEHLRTAERKLLTTVLD